MIARNECRCKCIIVFESFWGLKESMQSKVSWPRQEHVHASRRALCTITITNNARKYLGWDGDVAIREQTNPSMAYHIFPYNKQPFGRTTILLFYLPLILLLLLFSFFSVKIFIDYEATSYSFLRSTRMHRSVTEISQSI